MRKPLIEWKWRFSIIISVIKETNNYGKEADKQKLYLTLIRSLSKTVWTREPDINNSFLAHKLDTTLKRNLEDVQNTNHALM